MVKAKYKARGEAVRLRKRGKSYSEIKSILGVSKSTLSLWLREYPLSPEKIRELRDHSKIRIERYIETRRVQRELILSNIYDKEEKRVFPLSNRELFLAGLFLYWGEGGKTQINALTVSNNDPAMIKFFLKWLKKIGVSSEKIIIRLHLYSDMDIKKEINFWSKVLKLSRSQVKKPYIKQSQRQSISYKGFGHGTCNLIVNNTQLAKRVLMGLKSIRDHYYNSGPVA